MVVQLHASPQPSEDDGHLADRDFLESALLNSAGPERALLNAVIRTYGFAHVGSPGLRHNARCVLSRHSANLSEAGRVLLLRLANAGYQQPGYLEYTAVPVLCRTDDAMWQAPPETIARIALRTVADELDFLLRLPQLASHPDRIRLEERVAAARELSGSLAFGPVRAEGPEVEGPSEDPIEHGAMLPESGIPEELLFQGVTQPSEVIFTAAYLLAMRAAVRISHDQAALAAADLHYAATVEKMLVPLLRILVSMEVSTWLQIRPFIERPSAIQSPGFRALRGSYLELERIYEHPRYPEHERSRISWVRDSLTEAIENFERWQSTHLGIAIRYTPGGSSPGTQWLEPQVAPIKEKRRAARKDKDVEPPSSGCPLGY